jgi:hypothetical protein
MKKFLALSLTSILFLSGCGDSGKGPTLFVPSHCDKTTILASFPESISNPTFIDTPWEPAEGTDLFEAIAAGGIACSFGIQEAEIGATIFWANDDGYLFNERAAQWLEEGQQIVDIPKFDEEAAYALTEAKDGETEKHVRAVNFLISGFWIHIGATFADSLADYTPLAQAAFASLRDKSTMESENISGCFVAQDGEDQIAMRLDQQDRNIVSAEIFFGWTKKESNSGFMAGDYHNGVLSGTYQYTLNGKEIKQELEFIGDKTGFDWNSGNSEVKYKLVPSDKCAELLNA